MADGTVTTPAGGQPGGQTAGASGSTAPASQPATSGNPSTAATSTPSTGNESGAPDWAQGLPPERRQAIIAKGFKDVGALTDAYFNLEKFIGVPADRLLKMPGEKATDAEIAEYRTRLGVPAKPEEYGFQVPEGSDPAFAKAAAEWFHQEGVPVKAATKLVERFNEFASGQAKAAAEAKKAAYEKDIKSLQDEWGPGVFEHHVAEAQAATRRLGEAAGLKPEHLNALEEAAGSANLVKFMYTLATRFGEAPFYAPSSGSSGGAAPMYSPAEAQARLVELKNSPSFAKRVSEGDRDTLKELTALHKQAFPEGR